MVSRSHDPPAATEARFSIILPRIGQQSAVGRGLAVGG